MPRSLRTAAIVAVTGVALFMVVLDNLIVASSLPALQSSLHASLDSVEWVIDAYILTIGVTLLTGAALGDRYGRKRVFVLGLVLFTASSAAAALAPSIGFLVGARVVQGLGSAMVLPLTLTLVSAAFPLSGAAWRLACGRRSLAPGWPWGRSSADCWSVPGRGTSSSGPTCRSGSSPCSALRCCRRTAASTSDSTRSGWRSWQPDCSR
jgi:MFS family permease